MGVRKAIRHSLSATDPGRTRLAQASAVAGGMLLSALWAKSVITTLNADQALLTVGISMAMQMGLTPRDTTARGRFVTTVAMFIPAAVGAVVIATLSPWKPAAVVFLVVVTGAGVWARRFGDRVGAIGFAAFWGCFFPLLLQLTVTGLPAYLLVAAGAVGSLALTRVLLLLQRPGHQIELLLRELQTAAAASLSAAESAERDHPDELRRRLARMDAVGVAITRWLQTTDTERFIGMDADSFGARVLDARIDVEQTCVELVRHRTTVDGSASVQRMLGALHTVLDPRAAEIDVMAAEAEANGRLAGTASADPDHALLDRLARSVLVRGDFANSPRTTMLPMSVSSANST